MVEKTKTAEFWDKTITYFKESEFLKIGSMSLIYTLTEAYTRKCVFELGCGSGIGPYSVCALHPYPFHYITTDNSPNMLEATYTNFQTLEKDRKGIEVNMNNEYSAEEVEVNASGGGKVNIMRVDGGKLPFKGETFDAYIASHSISFVPDILFAFNEAYRVLKPSGRLGISAAAGADINTPNDMFTIIGDAFHAIGVDPKGYTMHIAHHQCQYIFRNQELITQQLTQIGFKTVNIHINSWPKVHLNSLSFYENVVLQLKDVLEEIGEEKTLQFKKAFIELADKVLQSGQFIASNQIFIVAIK